MARRDRPIDEREFRDVTALTNNSGGTADGTVEAVSGSGADAAVNNNFAELAEKVEELRARLDRQNQ